jgi:hypothetical protein
LHQHVQASVISNETTTGRWANQFSDPRPIIFSDSPSGTLRNAIPLKKRW